MNRVQISLSLTGGLFLAALNLFAAEKDNGSTGDHKVHWSYSGKTGPEYWAGLSPEYAIAGYGRRQSPIDLGRDGILADIGFPRVSYHPVPLKIENNGHTLKVSCPFAGQLKTNGETYEVLQVHFHSPSEHTVDGGAYPMEIHFVHKNRNEELAVLGVFVKPGLPNDVLGEILVNAPQTEETVEVPDSRINLYGLLPADRSIWRYNGSLTTPPCSEGVLWSVFMSPITASPGQIEKFKTLYDGNARPVQPIHDRFVLQELN